MLQVPATQQRFHNLKLSLGNASVPPFDPKYSALSLVPLVEPIRGYAMTYPKNIYGETPHTVMADQISSLVQAATSSATRIRSPAPRRASRSRTTAWRSS